MSKVKSWIENIRKNLYISESTWCVIQTIVLTLGFIASFYFGVFLAIIFNFWDIPIICVHMFLVLFIYAKFKIEEEFSDVIDS